MLDFFPVFTRDGLEWCLRNQVTSTAGNEIKAGDYEVIQILFCIQLATVPTLSCVEQVFLFKHVFGEVYDPERCFPFLIGSEETFRLITISADRLYGAGTEVYSWLKRGEEKYKCTWICLLEYWFSLFSWVDSRFFNKGIDRAHVFISGGDRLDIQQSRLHKIMHWCFDYPNPAGNGPEGEPQRRYLAEFKARMDNLEHYPGELKQLWESIKAEHA